MATCSIFANPIIDTEEGAMALADAWDRFLEEEAQNPPEPVRVDPEKAEILRAVFARVRNSKA